MVTTIGRDLTTMSNSIAAVMLLVLASSFLTASVVEAQGNPNNDHYEVSPSWPCPTCSTEAYTAANLMGGTLDEDGWREFTPSSDSVIVYVSSSLGNDNNSGLNPQSPVRSISRGRALLRDQHPDWLLLRRGDDFFASNDETSGEPEFFNAWSHRGRSIEEPMVIGSYGDDVNPPRLMTGLSSGFQTEYRPGVFGGFMSNPDGPVSNLAIVGIHFVAHTNDHYCHNDDGDIVRCDSDTIMMNPSSIVPVSVLGETINLWLEDLTMEEYGHGLLMNSNKLSPDDPDCTPNCSDPQWDFVPSQNVTIRRCRIYNNYVNPCGPTDPEYPCADGTDNGMLIDGVHGLLIEENIIDANTWGVDDGTADLSIFDKSLYLTQNEKTNPRYVAFRNNIVSRAQEIDGRPGGHYENNLFLSLRLGLNFGIVQCCEAYPGGVTGTVMNNVFLEGPDVIGGRQGGWGLDLANIDGSDDTIGAIVSNNVFAHGSGRRAIALEDYNDKGVGIQGLQITENVFFDWGPIVLQQGPTCQEENLPCNEATFQQEPRPPRDISFTNNIFYQSSCSSCDCTSQMTGEGCSMVVMRRYATRFEESNPYPIYAYGELEGQSEYDLSNNLYQSNGCEERFFWGGTGDATSSNNNVNSFEVFGFAEWETYAADTTSKFVRFNEEFANENRTIAAYCSFLGNDICTSVDTFAVAARTMQKGTGVMFPQNSTIYDSRLTATQVNNWVRSGLMPSASPQYEDLTGDTTTDLGDAQCPMNQFFEGDGCSSNATKDEYNECLESKDELSKNISCLTGLGVNEAVMYCVNDCNNDEGDFNDCRSACVAEESVSCYQPCYEEWATCCASDDPNVLFPPWKCNDLFAESDIPTVVNGDICAQNLATCIYQSLFNITSDDNEEDECRDSLLEIKVGKNKKKSGKLSCEWAARKNTERRCKTKLVKSHCPVTCNAPEFCSGDSRARKLILKENNRKVSCNWVKKKPERRCGYVEMCDTCRATCGADSDHYTGPCTNFEET